MRGRKPKPTALKLIAGNPGKRALPKDEPEYEAASVLEAPAWMDEGAKAEWDRIAPELEALGLLRKVGIQELGAYCRAVSRLAKAEAIIAERGMTFEAMEGPKVRPEVAISSKCAEEIRKFGADFGLTPATSPRVHATKKPVKDAKAEKAKRFFGS